MRKTDIITVNVPTETIKINRNEAAMRLKVSRNYESELILQCLEQLQSVIKYRYSYTEVAVRIIDSVHCETGFGDIASKDLCRTLNGCTKAYIVGATTGLGVDRLLSKFSITSQTKNFVTDALSSAAVESLCEYVDNKLRGNGKKPMRFSPGYGDMSIEYQPKILDAIDAYNTLGITLNRSLLMTPVKSITAIMGVYDD